MDSDFLRKWTSNNAVKTKRAPKLARELKAQTDDSFLLVAVDEKNKIIGFARGAIETTLLLSLPLLLVGMVVGLVVSIFQSVTQIQEMTLSFVPKIIAVFLALLVFGPWMLNKLLSYCEYVISNLPQYIR
jgi:flagellar biosynthetic protein FliQ